MLYEMQCFVSTALVADGKFCDLWLVCNAKVII